MKVVVSDATSAIGAVVLVIVAAAALGLIMAYPTMWAWEWFAVPVFHMPPLTFMQALGLNLLAGLVKSSNTNNNNNSK